MDIIHFNEAVDLLGLKVAIKYRNLNNPTGELPYHNNKHMDFMLSDCINAYLYSRILAHQFTLRVPHYHAVCYTAIFHDCDHSGGKLPDSDNIDRAIIFWNTFVESGTPEWSDIIKATMNIRVPLLLRATQYPYVPIVEVSTLSKVKYENGTLFLVPTLVASANILRDADLMTIYHGQEGIELVNYGLFEEMSAKDSIYGEMTYSEYIVKSKAFLDNIKWHSKWGERRAELMEHTSVVDEVMYDAEYNRDLQSAFEIIDEHVIIKEN